MHQIHRSPAPHPGSRGAATALVLALLAAWPAVAQGVRNDPADDLPPTATRLDLVATVASLAGEAFTPPPCVAGSEAFDDVPAGNPFCPWIEELARRGITSGCGGNNYCPGQPVSRAQMAPFLLVASEFLRPRFAVVNTGGGLPTLTAGHGVTAVSRSADSVGGFFVTFDRDVLQCAAVATYGPNSATFVEPYHAVVRRAGPADVVFVVIYDDNGAMVDGKGFHLAVHCAD